MRIHADPDPKHGKSVVCKQISCRFSDAAPVPHYFDADPDPLNK